MVAKARDPDERFFHFLNTVDWEQCWEWQGGCIPQGYGSFIVRGEHPNHLAHRYAYERLVGPIPAGLVLDHVVCENRKCCNPAHVEPTTVAKNWQRSNPVHLLARANREQGVCLHGHPYIENTYINRQGWWSCRECHRLQEAARKARLRKGITPDAAL